MVASARSCFRWPCWPEDAPIATVATPSVQLVITINDQALALSQVSYTGTVTFTNLTNGKGNTNRRVLLTVTAPRPSWSNLPNTVTRP